jgi:hypothetical protein
MSERKQPLNGKRASRPTEPRSKTKATSSRYRLEQLLASAYDQHQKLDGAKINAAGKRNFIFHMTDWSEDLERLAELYKHPEKFDKKTAGALVAGFLYHVIPHLRAAGRLMLDYNPEDFFRDIDSKV